MGTTPAPAPLDPTAVITPVMPTPCESGCCEPILLHDCCNNCPSVFHVDAEYLLWWAKKSPITNPLLTSTTQAAPISFFSYGAIPDANTTLVFGDNNMSYHTLQGLRFGFGYDLNNVWELEARGFFTFKRTSTFGVNGDANGNPPLFVPQINVEPLFLVPVGNTGVTIKSFGTTGAGFPTSFNGNIDDQFVGDTFGVGPVFVNGFFRAISSMDLWGTDVSAVAHLNLDSPWRVDVRAGFRMARLDESLDIIEGTQNATTNINTGFDYLGGIFVAAGSQHIEDDSFRTHNQFYGAQIGATVERDWGRFSFQAELDLSIGGTTQDLEIAGATRVNPTAGDITPVGSTTGTGSTIIPYVPVSNFGGIFTNPANIGHHDRAVISVLPEADFKLGYDLTSYLRLTVGWTFMYWSNVIRPGQQLDLLVNQSWTPSGGGFNNTFSGNAYPRVLMQQSDFWVQGLDIGAEFRF